MDLIDSRFDPTEDDEEGLFGGFSFRNIVVDELKKSNYYEEEEEEEDDDEDLTEALLIQMGYGKTGPPKHEPPPMPLPADNLKSAMKVGGKKEGFEEVKERKGVTWAEDVYDPTPSSDSHYAANRTDRHKNDGKKSGKNRQKGGGKGSGGGELGGFGGGGKGGKDKDKKDKKRGGGGGGGDGGGGGGGGAKGGKGKDKKQVKKHGGSASKTHGSSLDGE